MKPLQSFIIIFVLVFAIISCSGLKAVPEGDLLYTGGNVTIESDSLSKPERKNIQSSLEELLRPKPNKKILGMRPKLFFYNLAGKVKKEKGFWYWLKYRVGEEPVLFSKVDLEYNGKVLQNSVENNGYFNASTIADSTKSGKTAKAEYSVKVNKQYFIKSVRFPNDSSDLTKAINKISEKTLLQIGNPYSLANIKLERSRIDAGLKEKGFFYFNEDYILIQADSTVANHEVDLILKIKNETPNKAKNKYKINDIIVYPNFKLNQDTITVANAEIIKYNDFIIIDKEKLFKPRIFDRALYFKKGDVYNRSNHNLSLNRLVTLGTFKFVKNQFKESDTIGNYLDAYYYLTPLPRKSIRLEALAKTNSANYTGTELNINWSNRNTFHGAELLTVSIFGGVEVQVSGQNNGFNVYRVGTEANFIWPRFISPFKLRSSSGFVPRTKATLGYEYQLRQQLYSLQTLKGSFGYIWKKNERKEHELNVSEITYVASNNVSDLYNEQIAVNASLGRVIQKQLIFGPTYSYTYQNTNQKRTKNTFYFKSGIDLSGNLVGLASGTDIKTKDPKTILNVPYSQFVKLEADFRHYLNLGGESQLASRIVVGSGFAYGNSKELPFIKQFFIGGTNSIRAFRVRSIGPGSFDNSNSASTFLPDQSGDAKLELNTEFRGKIYSIVKGALFVDAGNIWLLNEDPNKPGAKLSSKFLNELAVGVGAGLRFDFDFLVLRTDFAFPIRKPNLAEGNRWVINQIDFGSGPWRSENLIFNLAIGYPF
ncbi:MAG: outer membrane protein insertion porin family [Flavobacterium sp.]|jgi:outer membrane protein insertion porin family